MDKPSYPTGEPFSLWIDEIRRRIGPPPRKFSLRERLHIRVRKPIWLPASDPLIEHYLCRSFLCEEGGVVWASLVQGNEGLFSPGASDAPAMLIYSFETSWSDNLIPLEAMAQELFSLKEGERFDPEEEQYGEMLADEYERALGWAIPSSISRDRDVRSTGVMVHRKHLPQRLLTRPFVPVLAHPESRMVFIVPSTYWPDMMLEAFERAGASHQP